MESPPRRAPARRHLGLALLFAAAPAAAAARGPVPAACAAGPGDAAVALAAVTSDGDVVLADGRALRLVGLDLPRATPASPDLPVRAGAALLAWAAAGPVALRAASAAPDRWGRVPALLLRAGEAPAGPADAGEALLAAGLARVEPDPAAHPCREARLAAEEAARAGRRGLWADSGYAVLRADDADGLAAQAGGLAVVEGVLHRHESRGATYLALGRGRRGFAAVVSRRDAKLFTRAGLDFADYEGTPVRLRGDLDARFGPRLRLADPDGVESLEPGSVVEPPQASGNARPKHWTAEPGRR